MRERYYLSVDMVKEIMTEFKWPVDYNVYIGNDLLNNVIIEFPTCKIDLFEVPFDGIALTFIKEYEGENYRIGYDSIVWYDCIENYDPDRDLDLELKYKNEKDRMRKNVRNKMKNLQFYHLGFIKGEDLSWFKKYLIAFENEKKGIFTSGDD